MRLPNSSSRAAGSSPATVAQPTSSWNVTQRGSVFSTMICHALLSHVRRSIYFVANSAVWLCPKTFPVPFCLESRPSRFKSRPSASVFS